MEENNKYIFIGAALVVGLVLGFFIGSSSAKSSVMTAGVSNVNDIKVKSTMDLNNLLREHAVMGANTLIMLYDGKDTAQMEKLMNDNANKITLMINDVYGADKSKKFADLWMKHMDEYKNYTTAKRDGNVDAANTAKANLNKIADELGKTIESPSLSANSISALLKEHINGTLAIVDEHAQGDAMEQANLEKAGYDQAGEMAAALSAGIIKDHPDKFK